MTSIANPRDLIGTEVVDRDGERVGRVGNVYVGDDNRQPQWVTVRTGLFGQKESFVPLQGARMADGGLCVQTTKDAVKEAPRMDADGHLSDAEGRRLYEHYGLTGMPGQRGRTTPSAGRKGSDEQAMVRSEEQLRVGTEQTETGRVRLHKYVVTEEQQVTVPVRHEEVRVEREPVRGGERARIGEDDQEVVLHAERPVVETEAVPVEKVRLNTETVTEQRTVRGKVRKERIEVDDSTKHGK
ncbi:DUF2382 domain-containing protein [Kutzneria kofuensis]|uniref:Uncharacterized protein (TIGR02271 family) n=1 Tax=Kutzneria kofuensis TaxID=103725 RepID=A0A7W9NHB0_9PSEU|nr:PRC and DUF2382 domain-containing protein [Kutzneria kofuensis]MBB5892041.1 uncharacterized protein (TIGR02271 family) [Kutzneria kofuensis]